MNFINETKAVTPNNCYYRGAYGYDKAPNLLFFWSRLFQSVISQATTYLLTGKFHNRHCSIYKAEGGCDVPGVGELVLCNNSCYFDTYNQKLTDEENKAAALITHVVLNWNPNDPVDSMIKAASDHIGVKSEELMTALEQSKNGGIFGGNALSSFFDWNPFSEPPIDEFYEKWCLMKFDNKTSKEVDQMHADLALGKKLLARLNEAIRERHPDDYVRALCCSPQRNGDGVQFWVNTGRSTQIDGWKYQKQLEDFITSKEKLVDRRDT